MASAKNEMTPIAQARTGRTPAGRGSRGFGGVSFVMLSCGAGRRRYGSWGPASRTRSYSRCASSF